MQKYLTLLKFQSLWKHAIDVSVDVRFHTDILSFAYRNISSLVKIFLTWRIPLIKLIYHIEISLIRTMVFPFVILIQLFYWFLRKNWMCQLLCLTHFWPMFNLCRNHIVGFCLQNVWKAPVEEWHFISKNQLPGLSVSKTLVENELISQIFLLVLSS